MKGRRPRVQSAILNYLRQAEGRVVSRAELIDAAYGGDADGGPLFVANNINTALHHLRKKGYPIESKYGQGVRFVPDRESPAEG